MIKFKKPLSLVLALLMILGGMYAFPAFDVSASTVAAEEPAEGEIVPIEDFTIAEYANIDEKLATFGDPEKPETLGVPVFVKDGYELYFQPTTGEVAIKDTTTNQILTSNPYDVGQAANAASIETKQKLLSQLVIKYTDADKEYFFNTYEDSAMNRQIKMKKIKGGIRVEYTIGKEEKRKLVPRMIEKESFETNIAQYITNDREKAKLFAYYSLKDANDPTLTERARKELQVSYPITQFMAIYIFDPIASDRELGEIEGYIKKNTKYTFEMMDEDHSKVNHVPKDKAPPLFKLALEYYIDEGGFYVRLPANGIRFDESTYKLSYISILPYMGANRRENTGYTFIPDGSGTLVRSEDIKAEPFTLTNKIYGMDFSFFKTGSKMEKWRMPVYGVVENYTISRTITTTETIEAYVNDAGETVEAETVEKTEIEKEKRTDGFLAIVEEGDAMAEISTDHGGNLHKYNTAFTMFTPRPVDQYNLDAATTGLSSLITVSSRRKYAGNYIIRYVMLSGEKANYMGMATAYRNYLIQRDILKPISDTNADIPLFLESFGMIQTAERVFGFPAFLDTPLTTFDNIKTIIDDLNQANITNIKFRLSGWANDGLYTLAPTRVHIENKIGGKKGFEDMLSYAKSKGATIYPDLNFTISRYDMMFDGFDYKRDAARMMDNRISVQRQYFFLAQGFTRRGGGMVISPHAMSGLYDKAMKDYLKLDVGAISVASMGKELHSDQYRKRLMNREESEDVVTDLLEKIQTDNGKVMVDAGNAYSFKYVDSMLNVDLDSSRFVNASEAIPFFGLVTHGYIDIAGTPINMAGDYKHDLLKAIENGASPYFIVCYQNSNRLKESWNLYNVYYSVDYKTWLPDIIETYTTLNTALKDVRTKPIVGHEFLGDSNIVKVTYEGGTSFILNYNNYEVEVQGTKIGAQEFIKVS